jgi:hypothetical protein
MAGGNVHSVEGWEELLLPGRFAQLRGRGCRWNGSRLAARAPGAGASLGAAAAFRLCTARRRCAILRCGTSILAATSSAQSAAAFAPAAAC